ncbi:MAG: hypothetical protein OXE95_04630 [Chloroflexi bacterium]|nr:hypothetical protein [Chloroflexota bacterium]
MSNAKATALQNAHDLIERGDLEAAQEILAPFLESDADDAGLWWVYAHAVRESDIGQAALRRVLELDPMYPGARELAQDLTRLDAAFLSADPLTANESASAQSVDIDIDDWEDLQPTIGEPQTSQQSARIGTTVLVTALLLLIAGGLLIATGAIDIDQLLSGIATNPQPSTLVGATTSQPSEGDTFSIGTAVPQEDISSADRSAETGETLATAPTVRPSPTFAPLPSDASEFVQLVVQQIDDFSLDPRQAFLFDSDAGNTLVLQTCALPGVDFNSKVAAIMQAMVNMADMMPAEFDAVAAGLLNCDDPGASLRLVGVEARLILDFARGAIADRAFQREWRQLSEAPREPPPAAQAEAPIATATSEAPSATPDAAVETGGAATTELEQRDDPTPTVTSSPTSAPSPSSVPMPRAEWDYAQRVSRQIRDFKLESRQAFLFDSDAGNTLVLQTCALPGIDFNSKVAAIMQAAVTLADQIPAELDAVAAGLLNCDDSDTAMRIIGSETYLIRDFASGAIDDRAFQRGWKQLG